MFEYKKPGKYVAICNGRGESHYAKVFEFPASKGDEIYEGRVSAAWYFLNRVDYVASIEDVYPIEVFESLFSKALTIIDDLRFAKYATDWALASRPGNKDAELSPHVEFKDLL